MLSNAYFLAKFRFDTAENEPAKNLQTFANLPILTILLTLTLTLPHVGLEVSLVPVPEHHVRVLAHDRDRHRGLRRCAAESGRLRALHLVVVISE